MERSKQIGKKCKQEISRKQMGLQDQKKWSQQRKIGRQKDLAKYQEKIYQKTINK